jgi:hypothetical protein
MTQVDECHASTAVDTQLPDPRRLTQSSLLALILWAVLLTIVVGWVCGVVQSVYYRSHSYFFDPVGHLLHNACLYRRVLDEGRLAVAWDEWLTYPKAPLRTAPLALLAPGLLASSGGHLATALPALFCWLALLGWTVYRRMHSLAYAVGCMSLFCAIPGLYDPFKGLGAYWLDLAAALLGGGAALALLNSRQARSKRWIALFGVLAAAACLSRYVAGVFVFVACAPLLALYLWHRMRENGYKYILVRLMLLLMIITVLAGYFIVAHFTENMIYYSKMGYAANQGPYVATLDFARNLGAFVGWPMLGGLCLLGVLMLAGCGSGRGTCVSVLPILTFLLAPFCFLALILQVAGHVQASLYCLPFLFLLLTSPVEQTQHTRIFWRLAIVLLIVSLFVAPLSAWRQYSRAGTPLPYEQAQKSLYVCLAEHLAAQKRDVIWNCFFDEYSWIPAMEAFYRSGVLALPAGGDFFSVHQAYWNTYYPGLTPEEVSRQVYERTKRLVDVAVVFESEDAVAGRFNNASSTTVARDVSQWVREDDRWRPIFVIESAIYGRLSGYLNSAPKNEGAYQRLLRGLRSE